MEDSASCNLLFPNYWNAEDNRLTKSSWQEDGNGGVETCGSKWLFSTYVGIPYVHIRCMDASTSIIA